jgi:hypothetical protein
MKKKIIHIELERDNGNIAIKIKAPKELEDFFKKVSEDKTAKSIYWKNGVGEGQDFYEVSEEYKETMEKCLVNESYIDNYGNGLLGGDRYARKINIAPLRTKGLSEGYVVLKSDKFENISNLELEDYIRSLGRITKKLWETLINKTNIKSKITFEL